MIRLHQSFGAHAGRVLNFKQDLIRFGRLPECEVAFDPNVDLDASGRHAEVRRRGAEYVLTDVGSRNGTWINGRRVQEAVLATGDEIEFGPGGPRIRVEVFSPTGLPPGRSSSSSVPVPSRPAPTHVGPSAGTFAKIWRDPISREAFLWGIGVGVLAVVFSGMFVSLLVGLLLSV